MPQKLIERMVGYKATDKDMKCRDFQFKLGVWHECDGELIECGNGFHFCEQPSGPWHYYSEAGTRVFKVECEGVLGKPFEPGAVAKRVARKIRLMEEVVATGYRNTGYGNTGDGNTGGYNTGGYNTGYRNTGYRNTGGYNTGDGNTGYRNTGDGNTGYRNTGYGNTGDDNTGDGNTGDDNTGDGNTGDDNTGDGNTGDGNTGYRNTGDGNTGDGNTGDGNVTDYSAGMFCQEPQTVRCFDVETGLIRAEFYRAYPCYSRLSQLLLADDAIDFDEFKNLPGITPEKLASLHEKHKAAREGATHTCG